MEPIEVPFSRYAMSTILRNRARTTVIVFGLALFGLQARTEAATKVAVIEHSLGGGASWCNFLLNYGYECTVFPATGPTQSLDPFQIIVDISNVWSDPADLLADQMRLGKGVITWGNTPQALQIINKPIVQAWIGADAYAGGSNRLLTTAFDPILGNSPPGTELVNAWDSGGAALGGTEGHPETKVLARWENGGFPAILRNTWESGRSVYFTNWIEPFAHSEIFQSTFRELSKPIPAASVWGLVILIIALLIAGSILLRCRISTSVMAQRSPENRSLFCRSGAPFA